MSGKVLQEHVCEFVRHLRLIRRKYLRPTLCEHPVHPLLRRLHRSGMIPGESRPSDWLVLDQEPAGSAIILNNLETIETSRVHLLERERSNLVSLALLPGGVGTQRQRLRFLKKYFGENPIYPAALRALQQGLVTRQVQEIENLLAKTRSDTIQSLAPTPTETAQHLDSQ